MLKDLLYVNEHLSCSHYKSDYQSTFKYYDLPEADHVELDKKKSNYLFFVIEGVVQISCNEFMHRKFKKDDIILLPKSAAIEIETLTPSKLVTCIFDVPNTVCDKLIFQSFWKVCSTVNYDLQPVPIHQNMKEFLNLVIIYLRNGINCEHIHDIKQKELFLVFKWFYTQEELATLFFPIVGKSLDFKSLVLDNYRKTNSVSDLARLSGMGRSRFDSVFKDIFDMSPRQWMLKQTARHVRHHLANPETTISDIMVEFGFNSFTHFNRFCKQQFGCSPTQLMKSIREA